MTETYTVNEQSINLPKKQKYGWKSHYTTLSSQPTKKANSSVF